MCHVGLAMSFRNPELELADAEGDKLANSIQKVLRHYNIPDIASETKDWIGLILCCGSIYGPRIASAMMDRKMKAPAPTNDPTEMTVTGGT